MRKGGGFMQNKLYLIGNAHLDPVWLWRWQEGFSEILATFKSALDRMNDFPDFKFTSACISYYEAIEKIDPEMFEEIKKRVAEGRWNIVGGMFLQPDCNIPDGESFARHILISQRFVKEKFGITVKTGYNVDSFGHSAGLPKIFKAGGIDNYCFMRPMPFEQGREETLFNWESDDGSSVLTYRVPGFYNYDSSRLDKLCEVYEKAQNENTDLMAFYGVGNHGGGPTIKLIDEINKLNFENAVYSTPDEYFNDIKKDGLPTLCGDLQHHARGCYSAMSFVKAKNRECEQNLLAAEKLCVMANKLAGFKYPAKKLQKAWKNLMFNQFHDILGGCSIKKAYDDAGYLFGEVMSITEQAMYFAMQKIAWNIDTLKGEKLPEYKTPENWKIWEHEVLGTPIIVFNPHAWEVCDVVAVNQNIKKITDCDGKEIAFQLVRGDQTNVDDKYHTAFMAKVPAFGYAVYRIFTEQESKESFENKLVITDKSIENEKIKVEFDGFTGDISLMLDKESGKTIIDKPCRAILLDETDCDTWAHNKKDLGEIVGMFTTPEFKVIENGLVRVTLRVKTRYNDSVMIRDYSLMKGDDRITVKTRINFCEKHKALKFAFPLEDETVISKTAYGTIKKHGYTGEEPCGSFIASGNLAVANDSKYGYDTENGEMRMTVLRGAIYADHYGNRDEFCEYMEQGIHEFSYSVFAHKSNSKTERKASELNFGLKYLWGTFHNGNLPEKMCCFECNSDNLIVSAIKQKYDSDEAVIRAYEMDGCDTEADFKLFGKEFKADISHNAIKTYTEDGTELKITEWE